MRPVRRNTSPIPNDYVDYKDAKIELVSRFGSYCSYCERRIATNLAVEHIEPKKGDFGQPELAGRWSNFLLACVNCNSTKGDKQVLFNDLLFPDRDNTFYAFEYLENGNINPSPRLNAINQIKANNKLTLVGLDKNMRRTLDENGRLIALDKMSQRMEVWGIANLSLIRYERNTINEDVKNLIVESMQANGFFSVWMTVFDNYPEMKILFINAMNGTRESGCFDLDTAINITPHPNVDALTDGGKI